MSLFNAMKSDQATGSYGTEIGVRGSSFALSMLYACLPTLKYRRSCSFSMGLCATVAYFQEIWDPTGSKNSKPKVRPTSNLRDLFIDPYLVVAIETVFFKGWTGSGSLATSLEAIQREAPQRLEKQGWDILRGALTSTLR